MPTPMPLKKKLLFIPPVLLGVFLVVWAARNRAQPERTEVAERAQPVRVSTVQPRTVTPRLVGYGTAEPARTWRAVAEITARVESRDKHLDAGQFFPNAAELLRLDDSDVKLEVARLTADIASLEAQQAKLEASVVNDNALLLIERESLRLSNEESKRLLTLRDKKQVSPSEVDAQMRQHLTQKSAVTRLKNALRLAPSERSVLKSQLESARARLSQANADVDRAVIRAPFPCRISAVHVERTQPVSPGTLLIEADGIAVAKVTAHVPLQHLRPLISRSSEKGFAAALADREFWSRLGLEATVRLRAEGLDVSWEARFVRLRDLIDPVTRTAGIVVAVDNPYQQSQQGVRPPLVKGMYVQVELRGQPRDDCLVIPRAALHQGRVYVVSKENRLIIRPAKVDFAMGDELVLESGLAAGDRLVLSDLVPAIEGMLLEPQ